MDNIKLINRGNEEQLDEEDDIVNIGDNLNDAGANEQIRDNGGDGQEDEIELDDLDSVINEDEIDLKPKAGGGFWKGLMGKLGNPFGWGRDEELELDDLSPDNDDKANVKEIKVNDLNTEPAEDDISMVPQAGKKIKPKAGGGFWKGLMDKMGNPFGLGKDKTKEKRWFDDEDEENELNLNDLDSLDEIESADSPDKGTANSANDNKIPVAPAEDKKNKPGAGRRFWNGLMDKLGNPFGWGKDNTKEKRWFDDDDEDEETDSTGKKLTELEDLSGKEGEEGEGGAEGEQGLKKRDEGLESITGEELKVLEDNPAAYISRLTNAVSNEISYMIDDINNLIVSKQESKNPYITQKLDDETKLEEVRGILEDALTGSPDSKDSLADTLADLYAHFMEIGADNKYANFILPSGEPGLLSWLKAVMEDIPDKDVVDELYRRGIGVEYKPREPEKAGENVQQNTGENAGQSGSETGIKENPTGIVEGADKGTGEGAQASGEAAGGGQQASGEAANEEGSEGKEENPLKLPLDDKKKDEGQYAYNRWFMKMNVLDANAQAVGAIRTAVNNYMVSVYDQKYSAEKPVQPEEIRTDSNTVTQTQQIDTGALSEGEKTGAVTTAENRKQDDLSAGPEEDVLAKSGEDNKKIDEVLFTPQEFWGCWETVARTIWRQRHEDLGWYYVGNTEDMFVRIIQSMNQATGVANDMSGISSKNRADIADYFIDMYWTFLRGQTQQL